MKYLKIYLTSFTVFLEILKKKTENDQSTGQTDQPLGGHVFLFIKFILAI